MRSTTTVEGVETRATASYAWQPAGKPLAVHLSLEVVERMEREVIERFKAVTQRGSEIGGLLLGRMPPGQPLVTVEAYERVECDYARGPLYLLAEPDKQRLAAAIRRLKNGPEQGLAVVGFFRSNTRRELALDEDDLALMKEHFAEARQVCLLVKPFSMKPCVGGFFIWEAGRMEGEATYLQFPFKRSELTKGEYAKATIAGSELAATAAAGAGWGKKDGAGTAGPKTEGRVLAGTAPAKREEAAPAFPAAPRAEVRVSIPLVIPKREEPLAGPPRAEARAPAAPVTARREAPPPPPPPPPAKPEIRISALPVIAKREPIILPPAAAAKPESRAPMGAGTVKREAPAPPPPTKVEARTPVTPVTPVIPKRGEPTPPAKPEARAAAAASPKREGTPAPPSKPPARSVITSLGLLREEAPPAPLKVEARAGVAAVAVAAKREETVTAPAPATPEAAAAAPAAGRRVEPPETAASKAEVSVEGALDAARPRFKKSHVIAAVVALVLVGTGGLLVLRTGAGRNAVSSSAPDASSLALRVERNAGQLLLSWNREARLVQTAQAAVLSIFDGDHKEDVKLALGQLRSGSIVYSAITNDVSFKLEVTDSKGQAVHETVRVIAGRPSPVAPLGQAGPAKPEGVAADSQSPPAAAAAQPTATAPDTGTEPTPTPGGGAEPPPPVKPSPPQFRADSLAARLSPAPSLPEPPRLEGQAGTAQARAVYPLSVPGPPSPQVPKPGPPPVQETPTPAPSTAASGQPLRVGGNVQQALVVRQVTPTYPPLARQARVSGVVRVEATIGRDGRIVKAVALSGPPLLRQAATDAVRQWLYKPTTLNGQAVEVVTQVDVTFNLNR